MDEDEMHEKNKLNVIAHELENQIKLLREALGGRASDRGNTASKTYITRTLINQIHTIIFMVQVK